MPPVALSQMPTPPRFGKAAPRFAGKTVYPTILAPNETLALDQLLQPHNVDYFKPIAPDKGHLEMLTDDLARWKKRQDRKLLDVYGDNFSLKQRFSAFFSGANLNAGWKRARKKFWDSWQKPNYAPVELKDLLLDSLFAIGTLGLVPLFRIFSSGENGESKTLRAFYKGIHQNAAKRKLNQKFLELRQRGADKDAFHELLSHYNIQRHYDYNFSKKELLEYLMKAPIDVKPSP
jgi:hypothetical protein